MNKPELYNKTVDILVQAYLNDTLKHNNCRACAVGNLICANMLEGDMAKWKNVWDSQNDIRGNWSNIFYTDAKTKVQEMNIGWYNRSESAKEQIKSTGYEVEELAKIEYAFETAAKGISGDEWMFNGLMAVIDVLDLIHGNTDTTVTTTQKARFNKALITLSI